MAGCAAVNFITYSNNEKEVVPTTDIPSSLPIGVTESKPIELPPTKPNLIVPGQSVGRLFLGDSRDRAIELFGRVDTEYDYDSDTKLKCNRNIKELRFWEFKDKSSPFYDKYGNGAWVILRDDKIFQIKVQSDKIKTKDYITVMSDPNLVKRLYPHSEAYVKINSQCDCTGGDNLLYWIDTENGIAFEFHYNQRLKKKYLAYVFVFEPNTTFYPDGCVFLETQGWEKLKPFTLNEPKRLQETFDEEFKLRHQ